MPILSRRATRVGSNAALQVSAGGGETAEVAQFFARALTLDTAHKNACRTLINGLVSDGIWTKLDCLYTFAAQDATNAAINLKSSSFPITLVGAPTFTANQGWAGDAASTYWKNAYTPSTAGGVFTQNSAHYSVYIRTNRTAAANKVPCGASNAAFDRICFIGPNQAVGTDETYINSDTVDSDTAIGTAQGFWATSRTGASAGGFYRNGSLVFAVAQTSTGLPDSEWFFDALNLSGPIRPSDDQVAMATIGAGLNATEAGNLSSRVNAYMTAFGTNVY